MNNQSLVEIRFVVKILSVLIYYDAVKQTKMYHGDLTP